MDAYFKFAELGQKGDPSIEVFHFSWRDSKGEKGDYGLNVGPVINTFKTLINTTFMFQDKPDFIIECRAYEMTKTQFEFLQDHELDTLQFLNGLIPTGLPLYELDLSNMRSPESAMAQIQALLGEA